MNTFEFTLRLLTAFCLGAGIGFERQWRKKNAGLRTNTLVCIGSAAFVLIAIKIGGDAAGRITSYIVSGIGFLGGGVIMKDGLTVRGLNTAATLWCSAAIGALCALGYPMEALITVLFIISTNIFLRPSLSAQKNARNQKLVTVKKKNNTKTKISNSTQFY
ncbi:MgtC/SapB family protein [Chryseobacterium arthrosphaerae]|uniref:MgtC/SapB family protein n=1 Tax=Chryseobacterium arthrosphaerae TaxID=651561 RepID=A0ABU7QZ89_9FLAO|nr:MgtC/SapB family protein [Chryseobacterium arthrosphaerae]AYZ13588.1 MgtC/SapB family protein [Chryseobacterium arthrosphaerae]MDG4653138.1 MgtC/SapB family protein [Chryseobacterium arthrosphaerae]UEQ78891.1 MgtC/SapB family protein [Chryseobacterium arthrosphaerae]